MVPADTTVLFLLAAGTFEVVGDFLVQEGLAIAEVGLGIRLILGEDIIALSSFNFFSVDVDVGLTTVVDVVVVEAISMLVLFLDRTR